MAGYRLLEGYVVCIGDPAYVVGVFDLAVLKLGWTPTMYRFPNILFSTDDNGEDDEDDGRVQVVEAVDPIVIVPTLQTSIGRKASQNAVKPETISKRGLVPEVTTITLKIQTL